MCLQDWRAKPLFVDKMLKQAIQFPFRMLTFMNVLADCFIVLTRGNSRPPYIFLSKSRDYFYWLNVTVMGSFS